MISWAATSLTGSGARGGPVGSLVLSRLLLLSRRLIPDFLPMMLNDATRGCSHDGVAACYMTDYAADGGAFQTAFCGYDA